jgi:hypothetical protein
VALLADALPEFRAKGLSRIKFENSISKALEMNLSYELTNVTASAQPHHTAFRGSF